MPLMFTRMTPTYFPLSLQLGDIFGQRYQMPSIRSILPYTMDGPFKQSMNFLMRLAWSSKVQLPVLIAICFMAFDIRLQLEINIFWEGNHRHHHHHHHNHIEEELRVEDNENELAVQPAEVYASSSASESDSDSDYIEIEGNFAGHVGV